MTNKIISHNEILKNSLKALKEARVVVDVRESIPVKVEVIDGLIQTLEYLQKEQSEELFVYGKLTFKRVKAEAMEGDYVVYRGLDEYSDYTKDGKPYKTFYHDGDFCYKNENGTTLSVNGWGAFKPKITFYELTR